MKNLLLCVAILIWSAMLALLPMKASSQEYSRLEFYPLDSPQFYYLATITNYSNFRFAERFQDSLVAMVGSSYDDMPVDWKMLPPVIDNNFTGPVFLYDIKNRKRITPVTIGFDWSPYTQPGLGGGAGGHGDVTRVNKFQVSFFNKATRKVYFGTPLLLLDANLYVAEINENLDTVFYKKILGDLYSGEYLPQIKIADNGAIFAFIGGWIYIIDPKTDEIIKAINIRNLGQQINMTGMTGLEFFDGKVWISWENGAGWVDACLATIDTSGDGAMQKIYSEYFKAPPFGGIVIAGIFGNYFYMSAYQMDNTSTIFRKRLGNPEIPNWEVFIEDGVWPYRNHGREDGDSNILWFNYESAKIKGKDAKIGKYLLIDDELVYAPPHMQLGGKNPLGSRYNLDFNEEFLAKEYFVNTDDTSYVLGHYNKLSPNTHKIIRYGDSIYSFGDGCVGVLRDNGPGVSVKKHTLDNTNVYPNPSTGIVNFSSEIPQGTPIEVYNLQSKLVGSFLNENNSINLDGVPSGIYIIKVVNFSPIKVLKL